MHSWRNLEPKTITVVVTKAQGLHSERVSKSQKCKYIVTFCHGKKKQSQTVAVESKDGCPVFNTEAKLKVTDISEPLVLIVSDKDYHCGQVIVPTGQIQAKPEDCENPRSLFPETWQELEPTKKQSHPQGHLQFSCWIDELKPIASTKEKGLKGFLSKVDLRRHSSSRGSMSELSSAVSTPHLLTPSSSQRGSAKKPKPSPLARLKLGAKKEKKATTTSTEFYTRNSDWDTEDGRSSISGQSIDDRFSSRLSQAGSSFSSRGGLRFDNQRPSQEEHGGDPFAGTNPFGDYKGVNPFESEYKGVNPFAAAQGEEDTTDLDALTASVPSTPAGRRQRPETPGGRSSSSESNYSLDGMRASIEEPLDKEIRIIFSVTPLEVPLEGGTAVTIEGQNLAKSREEIRSVYLGDCELKEENIQFVTSSKIKVYTRRWYNHRGQICLKTAHGNLFFDKEFVFNDPNRPASRPASRHGSINSLHQIQPAHSRENFLTTEPSLISDVGSVSSRGRYRKAVRNTSSASRSMWNLHSGGEETAPKIKDKESKSPAGSWGKGMVSRLNKSFSDLTQPFLHKKKSSLGSQSDLSAAFGSPSDFPPPHPNSTSAAHRTNSGKKPKASACAARIERKTENGASSLSMSSFEEENKRLLLEVEALRAKVTELEHSNNDLYKAKKEREEFIDHLQARLLEANAFEFLCIDNKNGQTPNGKVSMT